MGTPEAPAWLDHCALDRCIAVAVDRLDAGPRVAVIAALERADAELAFFEDGDGDWVAVRVLGRHLISVHRSRVQRVGAN
jgi:hypothetical protein